MPNKINTLWIRLIGSQPEFPLESRIFHSISVCLIVLSAIYVPYNLFSGQYVASVSFLAIACIFYYQYHQSRYHGKKHSTLVFGLMGLILFSVNYFANSGIDGSTDIIWPSYLLLVFAISPYRQHVFWLIGCLVTFILIHVIEFYHPELVKHPFTAGQGQFIDRITAFPIPVVAIYIIITYIRRNYDNERQVVELRNKEILLQKELLEQSDSTKNKLMSIISHDMRAPLVNIQGYLELLNENELDDNQRPALEKDLLVATNNTMQMLSNLLYWTKAQMEQPVVNLVQANLAQVLRSTLEMEKAIAAKKGVSLIYQMDDGIKVTADIDMLQLVVRNLVSNAIKFTPKGGQITINAKPDGQNCKLTVSDNGKGIEQAYQEKIFKITADPAFGTNNEKGVGLGLSLCKEFIERQGGSIGFESIFGQGSNFYVFIPGK